MATIPPSMFVAPGSCHSSLRKYQQIQKRQQSQEMDINSNRSEVDGSHAKAMPTTPIGSPIGSPTPPVSPLNKMYQYFRSFSNPGISVPTTQADIKQVGAEQRHFDFSPQGAPASDQSSSPLNSPRSVSDNA
ncbi:uncharacterized protein [Antedon mediterranea]|uniref:uncharacterized protein n=1 Tax=Antedon mediterranea TaxID=105859 RepID=UPI003AF6B74D